MKRILITGAGGFASIGFIKCLRIAPEKFYLVGVDQDPKNLTVTKPLLDKCYVITNPGKEYIKILNKIIKKEKIDLIWSQPQPEVQAISKQRNKINAKIFLPDQNVVELCYNKYKTLQKLSEKNIPMAKSIMINKRSDIKKAFELFGDSVWLREIKGAGGKGAFQAKGVEEAIFWINFNNGWERFTASEVLPGRGYGCDMLFHNGELIFSQIKERLSYFLGKANIVGITGTTGVLRTVHDKDIDILCEKTVRAVDPKPNGVYAVDLKCDKKGNPKITEINAGRFLSSSVSLFYKTKFLAPYLAVKLAIDEKLDKKIKKKNPIPKDIIIVRQLDIDPALITQKRIDKIINLRDKNGYSQI